MVEAIDSVDYLDIEDLELLSNIRNSRRRIRIDPFTHYNDHDFLIKYRFTKTFVNKVVDLIKEDLPCDPRGRNLRPHIQVACALRCWSRHEIQDDTADLHGVSQQVVSKVCKNVAEALAKKANIYIKMPASLEEQESAIRQFREISDFPSVIGAIDCTHIRIKRVGGNMSEAYVNRKGYYSLNVQVVCDANLRIRNLVAGWRGSVHDSRIFNESSIKQQFEMGQFHGRLLGDSGYPCTPYLFTPILSPRNEKEEAYNRAHIKTRNTVERCFGVWKQRFRCLLIGLRVKLSTVKATIVALAVLHNIAIDMKEAPEDPNRILMSLIEEEVLASNSRPQDNLRGDIIRRNFINENF